MLHQFIDVDGLVEGLRLNIAGKLYELPGEEFLRHDAGMVVDMRRGGHAAGNLSDICGSASFFELSAAHQLVGDGMACNINNGKIAAKMISAGLKEEGK